MAVICHIRYEIDPHQLPAFEEYARNWSAIVPACGGNLIGYFMPHEGTNYEAHALIGFNNLADYEVYRSRIKDDPKGRANFEFAQAQRLILKEERTFLRNGDGVTPNGCVLLSSPVYGGGVERAKARETEGGEARKSPSASLCRHQILHCVHSNEGLA